MSNFTESTVEQAALAWLESMGYQVLSGPEIAPDEPMAFSRATGTSATESGECRARIPGPRRRTGRAVTQTNLW